MKTNEKKNYFGEKEEKAVIDYITTDSKTIKNNIYNEILIEPFEIMIQSILRRYPIHIGNYTVEEIENDVLNHLIDNMVKYKPFIIERYCDSLEKWVKLGENYRFIYVDDAEEKLRSLINSNDNYDYRIFNSRAYSYCQTIIRNYYKDHSRKSYDEIKTNVCFDNFVDEFERNFESSEEDSLNGEHHLERLINLVVNEINNKINDDKDILKHNEIIVGDAITNILKNWQVLFMEETPEGQYNKKVTNKFAKNKILLFLKEQTGLTTKEIRNNIKSFKDIYTLEKNKFYED